MSTTITALSAASALGGSEAIPCDQSGSTGKTTPAALATYVFTTGIPSTDAATLVTTDQFPINHGGTAKYTTGAEIATFTTAQLWANATSESGGATGDLMLMYRSGIGTITVTIDLLASYITTGLAATTLNLSSLSTSATVVGATDLLLVYQSSTAKNITMEVFEVQAFADFANYVCARAGSYWASGGGGSALGAVSAVGDADFIYCVQTTTPKYVTPAKLAAYVWGQGTYGTVAQIQGLTAKTTPVAADQIPILDSAASNAPKLATVASVKLSTVYTTACAATASTYTTLPTAYDWVEIQGVTGQTAWGWILGAAGSAGQSLVLIETAGYNGKLFPFTGGTINGLTATTGSITITAHHVYTCRCTAANTWLINDAGALPQS